ncbi:hypothetical protein [Catellatospora sp. NPDC049609]|uniref:hypothetical protein n=1 Tax=Catellatospora sp. NPDC049609 TaxID=3155505 RepID=UPI0034331DC4
MRAVKAVADKLTSLFVPGISAAAEWCEYETRCVVGCGRWRLERRRVCVVAGTGPWSIVHCDC